MRHGFAVIEVKAAIRQWRYPREFRIRAPARSDNVQVELAEPRRAGTEPLGAAESTDPGLAERSVAELATSLWRLRDKLVAAPEAKRSALRHLDAAWDTLAEAGVEVHDHVGTPFDSGLALTVVAFEPTAGLEREQVIETVRPSVYLNDRVVQTGEVIVGTPEPPTDPPPLDEKGSRP